MSRDINYCAGGKMKLSLIIFLALFMGQCGSAAYQTDDPRSAAWLANETSSIPPAQAVKLATIAQQEAKSVGAKTFTWQEDDNAGLTITRATNKTARVFGIVLDGVVKVWYLYQAPGSEFVKCTQTRCISQKVG